MAGKILEITLKSLQILENGEITRPEGRNLLSVSLVYPGPGKPVVTTMKPLRLGDHATVDFETDNNPLTGKPYTYADRILFKEEVVGETLLVAQVTDVEVPSKLTKFLAGLFSAVFKAAWDLFVPGGANLILAAAADSVATLQLETLKLPGGESLYVIGQTLLKIDPKAISAAPQDLIVPRDVTRDRFVFSPGSNQPTKKEQLILKQDQKNGSITFGVREL